MLVRAKILNEDVSPTAHVKTVIADFETLKSDIEKAVADGHTVILTLDEGD